MHNWYIKQILILITATAAAGSVAAMDAKPRFTELSVEALLAAEEGSGQSVDDQDELVADGLSLDATYLVHEVHDDCFALEMSPGELAGAASTAMRKLDGYAEDLTRALADLADDTSAGANEKRDAINLSISSIAEKKAQLNEIVKAIERGTFNPAMIAHHRSFASHLRERELSLISSGLLLGVMVQFAGVSLGALWLPVALGGVIGGGIKMLLTRRAGGTWRGALKTGAAEFISGAAIGAATAGLTQQSLSVLPLPNACSGIAGGVVAGGTASLLRDAGSRKAWQERIKIAAVSGALGGVVAGVFELGAWVAAIRHEVSTARSGEDLSLLEDELATMPGLISEAMQAVSSTGQGFASNVSQGITHACSGDVCSMAMRSVVTQSSGNGLTSAAQQLASAQKLLIELREEQHELAVIIDEKKEQVAAQLPRMERFRRWVVAALMPDVPQVMADGAYWAVKREAESC